MSSVRRRRTVAPWLRRRPSPGSEARWPSGSYDAGATVGTVMSGRFLLAAAFLWLLVSLPTLARVDQDAARQRLSRPSLAGAH
jgi:hypothetical protein